MILILYSSSPQGEEAWEVRDINPHPSNPFSFKEKGGTLVPSLHFLKF